MVPVRAAVVAACVVLAVAGADAQARAPVADLVRSATALADKGQLEEAQSAAERAVAAAPTALSPLLILGRILEQRGDLAGASAVYEKAVALHPESAAAHDRLGFLRGRQDRVPEAI